MIYSIAGREQIDILPHWFVRGFTQLTPIFPERGLSSLTSYMHQLRLLAEGRGKVSVQTTVPLLLYSFDEYDFRYLRPLGTARAAKLVRSPCWASLLGCSV